MRASTTWILASALLAVGAGLYLFRDRLAPRSRDSALGGSTAKPLIEARTAATGATCADVSASPSGALFVSWLEPGSGADVLELRVARHERSDAREAVSLVGRTVVESERLFANWADFPHVLALSDSNVLVTYLERIGDGKYDYGVRFACSTDAGATWSEPRWLHDHVGPGEHGFVSLARADDGTAAAVWLDGREMGAGEHGAGGAMTLRMRSVGIDGALGEEQVLDERVCDCCQTDLTRAADGAWLIAYRDRSEDEVRDVKVLRVDDVSVTPVFDSADHFRFEGCPVNGPAIASVGGAVVLVWFAPNLSGGGSVRAAVSHDGGVTFPALRTLDDAEPSGRVEVAFARTHDAATALVLWLGKVESRSVWRLAGLDASSTAVPMLRYVDTERLEALADTSGARESGFPRAAGDGTSTAIVYRALEPNGGVRLARRNW